MIPALIIDDKPANIHLLQQMIDGYCPQVTVVGTAINIEAAYNEIIALKPALIFLDIEMPGGSGFELLQKFEEITFEVIFITAYNQYAIQAFRENALDYLLKPIDIDALQESVARAERQIELKKNSLIVSTPLQVPIREGKISIPVQNGYLFINREDIIRCEGSGSYTSFYMVDGKKLMVSLRLKECEALLSAGTFFRVHNSHIVNLLHVSRYVRGRGGNILMRDGSTVDVAASRKDAFLEIMKVHPY